MQCYLLPHHSQGISDIPSMFHLHQMLWRDVLAARQERMIDALVMRMPNQSQGPGVRDCAVSATEILQSRNCPMCKHLQHLI